MHHRLTYKIKMQNTQVFCLQNIQIPNIEGIFLLLFLLENSFRVPNIAPLFVELGAIYQFFLDEIK